MKMYSYPEPAYEPDELYKMYPRWKSSSYRVDRLPCPPQMDSNPGHHHGFSPSTWPMKRMGMNLDENDSCLVPLLTGQMYDAKPNHMDIGFTEYTDHSCVQSTAATKDSIFKVDSDSDTEAWKLQDVKNWSSSDVLHWIASIAETQNFPYEAVNAQAFNINGSQLYNLSIKDFIQLDTNYGRILYEALQRHREDRPKKLPEVQPPIKQEPLTISSYVTLLTKTATSHNYPYPPYYPSDMTSSADPYPFDLDHSENKKQEHPHNSSHETSPPSSSSSSSSDEESSYDKSESKSKKKGLNKRPPGRPPGVKSKKDKPEKKTGRLWEFIRDLLLDPQYCPSLICWENHDDGVFRFVKSDKVAKIWGTRKSNDNMTYEKLSRAMRYYYKSKVFQPVLGRRLVYKFGPTAKGWKTDNPNFKNKPILTNNNNNNNLNNNSLSPTRNKLLNNKL